MDIDFNDIKISTLLTIFGSIHIWAGFVIYGVGFILYLFILSKFEVSYIYPIIMSAGFVLLLILSILFLHGKMNLKKILGIAVISIGIFIISY